MTDFMDMFCEMLPMASNLQNKNNQVRKVLDYTIGEYMENIADIGDELFLTSATGGWLDAWGRDYGVIRRVDEDDDSFRERIIFEKLEYLTAHNLQEIYGVELFYGFDGFNPMENDLTSDNPYIPEWYMGIAPTETQDILNKKFILGGGIIWYNNTGLDYIFGYPNNTPILRYNMDVYNLTKLQGYYFKEAISITSLKLTLPKAINMSSFLYSQTHLVSVVLDCPEVTNCNSLLNGCTALTSAVLNIPKAFDCNGLLDGCTSLTSISLSLPNSYKCNGLFKDCTGLTSVDLDLPSAHECTFMFNNCTSLTSVEFKFNSAYDCGEMFKGCTSLTDVDLDFPECTAINEMFNGCSALVNLKFSFPELQIADTDNFDYLLEGCDNLENINVTIPSYLASYFSLYITSLNLNNLNSLIINGEEY